MSRAQANEILSKLFYSRAWYGTLGHFWLSKNLTLCGRSMQRWTGLYGSGVKQCKSCEKRRTELIRAAGYYEREEYVQ